MIQGFELMDPTNELEDRHCFNSKTLFGNNTRGVQLFIIPSALAIKEVITEGVEINNAL